MKFRLTEVLQVSQADCGPAAVASFLRGYGIPASYEELRVQCNTERDGSSYAELADVIESYGLPVRLSIVPFEHLLLESTTYLPGLVAFKVGGTGHVVLVAGVKGSRVAVMDPGVGLYHPSRSSFVKLLYPISEDVEASAWRDFAATDDFLVPLAERIHQLAKTTKYSERFIGQALDDASWRGIGRLDAAIRFCERLFARGSIRRKDIIPIITAALNEPKRNIPAECWHVSPKPGDPELLVAQGSYVISRDNDVKSESVPQVLSQGSAEKSRSEDVQQAPSSSRDRYDNPWSEILALWSKRQLVFISALPVIISLVVLLESVLLRGVLGERFFNLVSGYWLETAVAFLVFFVVAIAARWAVQRVALQFGLSLGIRYRIHMNEKIERFSPRFFETRPVADMANRFHLADILVDIPAFIARLSAQAGTVILATAAMAIISPTAAIIVSAVALLSYFLTKYYFTRIRSRESLLRVNEAALGGYYMQALQARMPLKTHAAEALIAIEHETKLVMWQKTARGLIGKRLAVLGGNEGLAALGFCLIVYVEIASGSPPLATMLILYWYLIAVGDARQIAAAFLTWIPHASVTLARLNEVISETDRSGVELDEELEATFERLGWQPKDEGHRRRHAGNYSGPVHVEFSDVSIVAHGQYILRNVSLDVPAGSHVAVVGRSGAGKSTIVAALLGHQRVSSGEIRIDGRALSSQSIEELSLRTAWVDPSVHLWNDTLLRNLFVGERRQGDLRPDELYDRLELADIVTRMHLGGASGIGEEGRLLSGGEGQRLRIGRGLAISRPSLALLDEAFRGLDYRRRDLLMRDLREEWRNATLFCVTHDMDEAVAFDRIVVIDSGHVIEYGTSSQLMREGTAFHRMWSDHQNVKAMWADRNRWEVVNVEDGHVTRN